MITYRAALDVPEHIVRAVARWLQAWRRVHDIRPWQRAATSWTQAVMFLRWARDATAVQHHLLGALYPKAARGLPIVAGKGYIGAGIGIHAPTQGKTLDPDARSRNRIICELRAPCERANAMLKSWKALQHVTFCPQKIGQIVAAVLVLTHMKYPSNYPWRENLNVCPRWGAPTGQDPENRFNLSTPIHKPARC